MLSIKRIYDPAALDRPVSSRVLVSESVLLRVTRSGFSLQYMSLQPAQWRTYPPRKEAEAALVLQDPNAALFAAFADDRLVGTAVVRAGDGGWAEIVDIRVDVQMRRQGVGSQLLDACWRFGQHRGAEGLCITATDQNPVLCQFCTRLGFVLGGMDQMALTLDPEEKAKPLMQRACLLTFYRMNKKG